MTPEPNPTRRRFLAGSAALAATAAASLHHARAQAADTAAPAPATKFKLAYGPHPGMFKESAGNDLLDLIPLTGTPTTTVFRTSPAARPRGPTRQTFWPMPTSRLRRRYSMWMMS